MIDGIVAYFSYTCHDGLFMIVAAAFGLVKHYQIWIPWNIMKFNMSLTALFESGNVVFTFCDVSHFQKEITEYTDYGNWEQYISLSARISGIMISDFWRYYACIQEGRLGANGWDVGLCSGRITALMVDTLF